MVLHKEPAFFGRFFLYAPEFLSRYAVMYQVLCRLIETFLSAYVTMYQILRRLIETLAKA